MTSDAHPQSTPAFSPRAILLAGWVVVIATIAFSFWRLAGIGLDLKHDFWVYFTPNHFNEDANSALQHGDMVLREAESIADDDESRKTPEQLNAEARAAAAGHPIATVAHPGPGLFESPLTPGIFRQRWHHLRPVYSQILRGWVHSYETLYNDRGPDGNYGMDYPPMRLLVMSLWTWYVQTNFPGVNELPREPQRVFDPDRNQSIVATMDIVQPLLKVNAFCEAVSALAIFALVWIWMDRNRKSSVLVCDPSETSWKSRWGDPMLLAPVAIFGLCTLVRPHLSWQMPLPGNVDASPIDERVSRVGWWVFLLLRYVSVICLARFLPRPYRAPICALVAATLAWLNPSTMPDDFGWPQWDCWLPPFFLVAAVLISVNFWATAGFLLGVGCMFKGQLIFVCPVLILCPLIAGWPGRFLRMFAGLLAGAGMVLWPWRVTNQNAVRWLFVAFATAAFFCALSATRNIIRRQAREAWNTLSADLPRSLSYTILCSAVAFLLCIGCLIFVSIIRHGTPGIVALYAISIFLVPWFIPRRLIGGWLLFAFAVPLWLVGSFVGGSRTWWDVGFVYGTQRHEDMQLGEHSLCNLSSLLHEHYGWNLHDPIATFNLPFAGMTTLDVQQFCGVIFGAAILLCCIAAGIHMRRKDPRFLIVLVTPWVLFTILLTQMTARYMTLPAVVGSLLIGISVEMSLLPFLQTVLATLMLGNQMLMGNPDTAPVAFSITQPTYPELGWLTVLLAAVFLCSAVIPSRRWRRPVEVL